MIGKNAFQQKFVDPELEVLREDEIPKVKQYLLNRGTIRDLGVLLQLETGLRVGELASLKREDWKDGFLKIRRTEARRLNAEGHNELFIKDYPKTAAGARDVILTPQSEETLKRICQLNPNGTYLFENEQGKRIRANTFNKRFSDCLRDLGLPHRSSHKLRKTYGTVLHDGGADDAVVQRQLGHTSIETSRKYYYFGNKTRERQIEQVKKAVDF